jgi:integrase
MKGSVVKRCSCPARYGARGDRLACKIKHGSWSFVADCGRDSATGKRRQIKKGGFATKAEAEAALAELVDQAAKGVATFDGRQSVGVFLVQWIDEKEANGLRRTTVISYRQHIKQYFVPAFGNVRLKDLRPAHVEAMLADIAKPRERRSLGSASVRRIHATLRSALGTAKRRRLISINPAVDIELPAASRPKVHPWEPEDLGIFLDAAVHDTMGALFETVAGSAGRRGEVLGLRWADVDFDRGRAVLREQLLRIPGLQHCTYCGEEHRGAVFGPIKTRSGEHRRVDLDAGLLGVLIGHRLRQDAEKAAWGTAYIDHDLVFAQEDGAPIPPDRASRAFKKIVKGAGVRQVRLHDLRHGRASLLLASGTDIALVSKLLGHSSIGITVDTYAHLLEGVGRAAADRASALVPRNRTTEPCDQLVTNSRSEQSEGLHRDDGGPGSTGRDGAASGNRTPDNLITSEVLYQLS